MVPGPQAKVNVGEPGQGDDLSPPAQPTCSWVTITLGFACVGCSAQLAPLVDALHFFPSIISLFIVTVENTEMPKERNKKPL